MIQTGAQLLAHFAQSHQTIAHCWKVTLKSGTVYGFTDHDQNIEFESVTYLAATGVTRSDVATADDLSSDNFETEGMLISPAITEDDLYAGRWDHARYEFFAVNFEDLTMGRHIIRFGRLGEVSTDRSSFKATLMGLTDAYTCTIGEITSPACRNNLGDARCGVDLSGGSPSWTVTGVITGVGIDNQTVLDAGRAEPGPTGGLEIVSVTRADPGVVTIDDSVPFTLPEGAPVTISGATGMIEINTVTSIHNLSGNTFELRTDTTNFGIYTGGGTLTPLGGDSGYFDYGVFTFTSGLNAGLSMEVRSYVPGQFTLQQPMPYVIHVGDEYSVHVGCDKSITTCHDRFSNVVNFRGEPYLPGSDRLIQVGKQ